MNSNLQISKVTSFLGHKDAVYAIEKLDDQHFFSAGSDGYIVKWAIDKPEMGTLIAQVNNSVYAMHYIPSTNRLLVGQNNEGVYMIDLYNNQIIASAQITSAQIFDIKTIDDKIIVATGDGHISVLSALDLSVISKQQYAAKSARCIAVYPDQKSYAVGFSDYSIRIFNTDNILPIRQLEGHTNSVFALAYSADGKHLISGGRDATLKVWSCLQNYNLQTSIPAHLFAINDVKFLEDNNYFATASMDKTIKIWDANSFQLLKVIDKARYPSHSSSINKICAIKNLLLSGSDDKAVFLWDIDLK